MRFGIIGTGWIASDFVKAGQSIEDFEVVAVYSRSYERGRAFADANKISDVYTDINIMARSSRIDAVYIASPNSLHAVQSMLFLQNNIAVLCEKPSASNSKELNSIIDAARKYQTLFMEAMKITFLPNFNSIENNLKLLGRVRHVYANFCKYSSKYDDFKSGRLANVFNPLYSGGSLMDMGIYPIYFIVALFGIPKRLKAYAHILPSGVDGEGEVIMEYNSFRAVAVHSKISGSKLLSEISGDDGLILIDDISRLRNALYYTINDSQEQDTGFVHKNSCMTYEIEEFVHLYKSGKIESDRNSFTLSLDVMRTLDEVRRQTGVIFPADKL